MSETRAEPSKASPRGRILRFAGHRRTAQWRDPASTEMLEATTAAVPGVVTDGPAVLAPPIEIDHLYPDPARPDVVKALSLLSDANGLLEHARAALGRGDPIEADREMGRLELLLPELFACRKVGDGYASIINALHFAFVNRRGAPLTSQQVNVIWRVLRELRTRIFMPFDPSVEQVEELERSGLMVDPCSLTDLVPEVDV